MRTKVRLVDVLFTNVSGLGAELVDSKLVLVVLQPMRLVCGCNGVGVGVAGFFICKNIEQVLQHIFNLR